MKFLQTCYSTFVGNGSSNPPGISQVSDFKGKSMIDGVLCPGVGKKPFFKSLKSKEWQLTDCVSSFFFCIPEAQNNFFMNSPWIGSGDLIIFNGSQRVLRRIKPFFSVKSHSDRYRALAFFV